MFLQCSQRFGNIGHDHKREKMMVFSLFLSSILSRFPMFPIFPHEHATARSIVNVGLGIGNIGNIGKERNRPVRLALKNTRPRTKARVRFRGSLAPTDKENVRQYHEYAIISFSASLFPFTSQFSLPVGYTCLARPSRDHSSGHSSHTRAPAGFDTARDVPAHPSAGQC